VRRLQESQGRHRHAEVARLGAGVQDKVHQVEQAEDKEERAADPGGLGTVEAGGVEEVAPAGREQNADVEEDKPVEGKAPPRDTKFNKAVGVGAERQVRAVLKLHIGGVVLGHPEQHNKLPAA
jgi:hypothetical protein